MSTGRRCAGDYPRPATTRRCKRPPKPQRCAAPTRRPPRRCKALVDQARRSGDTLGGIFTIWATGVPVGLGSYVHWDRRLDGQLAGAVMSIQAIKGVEIGPAFENATHFGREIHDRVRWAGWPLPGAPTAWRGWSSVTTGLPLAPCVAYLTSRLLSGLNRRSACPPVGPAVVAAHPAGPRLRDRPARVPRPLRGLEGHGGPRRRAPGGRPRRDGGRRRARRRGRGRRLHEGRARRLPPRALRRIESGEQVVVGLNRYTETEPSPLTPGVDGGILDGRPRGRGRAARGGRRAGAPSATAPRPRPRWPSCARVARVRREHHAGDDRRRPRRA